MLTQNSHGIDIFVIVPDIQIRAKIFLEISQFQNFTIFHRIINFKLLDRIWSVTFLLTKQTTIVRFTRDTDQSRTINFSPQHFFISLLKFSFAVVKPTRIKGAKLFIRGRGYNRLSDPLSHQRAILCETISRRKRRWDNVFPLNLPIPCIIFGSWITSRSYHAYEGRENVPL